MAKLVASSKNLVSTLLTDARPKFQVFLKYAKVELTPPTPADIPKITSGIKDIIRQTKNYKQLTVKEAWISTLVGVEVLCWFFVGECIGKRHIVGYKV